MRMSALNRWFGPAIGQMCWGARSWNLGAADGGNWYLTLQVGPPRLEVLDQLSEADVVALEREHPDVDFRSGPPRRHVMTKGRWSLMLEPNWVVSEGGSVLGSFASESQCAIEALNGQKLTAVVLAPTDAGTEFRFDLGVVLTSSPSSKRGTAWTLDGQPFGRRSLVFRADRHYCFEDPGSIPPHDSPKWRRAA